MRRKAWDSKVATYHPMLFDLVQQGPGMAQGQEYLGIKPKAITDATTTPTGCQRLTTQSSVQKSETKGHSPGRCSRQQEGIACSWAGIRG